MNELKIISEKNLDKLAAEIEDAYFDIPLGNTQFQNTMFIVAANITPARAYRAVGLQIQSLIQSLKNAEYNQKLKKIKIEELEYEINSDATTIFDKKRKQLELEIELKQTKWDQKNVNDTLHELNFYYSFFKEMPRFTREEFESNERLYYEQNLQRQCLGLTGAKEALLNMMDDSKTMDNFKKMYAELPDEDKENFNKLIFTKSMAGMLTLNIKKDEA